MADDTVTPWWTLTIPSAGAGAERYRGRNAYDAALANMFLHGGARQVAPAPKPKAQQKYAPYTDSTYPQTSRAGDADVLVRGTNYVFSLLAPKGFKVPKAAPAKKLKKPKRTDTRDADRRATVREGPVVVSPFDPDYIWSAADGLWNWVAAKVSPAPASAAGRTNRTGAKSTRGLGDTGPEARPGGEPLSLLYWADLSAQAIARHILMPPEPRPDDAPRKPRPFAPVTTDPESKWQPKHSTTSSRAPSSSPATTTSSRTSTSSKPSKPADQPSASSRSTSSASALPSWVDPAVALLKQFAEIKREGSKRRADAKLAGRTKSAAPTADAAALLGQTSTTALTGVDTDALALAAMQPSAPTTPATKVCECPPKKPRRKSCRNPVVSRTTKAGYRTTKVRIVCQPSKRK